MTNQLTLTEPQPQKIDDMRALILSMPSETIQGALAEFSERRHEFRDWLKGQLKEGTHYGFPPGCEPKLDDRGWVGVWSKGGMKYYPPEQWKAKPSLYSAGADFVVELMNVRAEFEADVAGWQQMGSPKETFVYACRLYSRANNQLLGEGRGVRSVGQKGGDANNAIKMAMKSAKVSAVLNAYGLADLFTQDEPPTGPPPASENPTAKDTPPVQPRGERVTERDCKDLLFAWVQWRRASGDTEHRSDFDVWASTLTGVETFKLRDAANWTKDMTKKCYAAIGGAK